ncbi:p2 protein [Grapevine deformation virus]|uniref:p2 protein n=2 Tax=Grapevine deformation virus TaxID=233784 RepID=Q6JX05_9SECO|nr:p2 protein [Grapevine deformation virus]AAQ56597.1 p2 protein [Grapevine deformation virus]
MGKFYFSDRRLAAYCLGTDGRGTFEQWLQCMEDPSFRKEVKERVQFDRAVPSVSRIFEYPVGRGPVEGPAGIAWHYIVHGHSLGLVPPTQPAKADEVVVPQPKKVVIPLPPPAPKPYFRPVGAFAPTRSGFIRATVERLSREREESRAAALFAELPLEFPQGAPLRLSLAVKFAMLKHTTWRKWYDTSDERLLEAHPGGPCLPPPPLIQNPPSFCERVREFCRMKSCARAFALETSLGLNKAWVGYVDIPSISVCCADGRTTGGQTIAQEADPLQHRVSSNTAPGRAQWISERRQALRRREQANSLQGLAAQTDMTFEQARNAYLGAADMIEQGLPLLPPLRSAYAPRGLWRGPSTRANYTLDFRLNGIPTGTNTLEILYNPVSEEEMEEFRDRGMSAVVIDALEIAINPFGMPGNPTDLTVVATYGHERDMTRAFIGSASTFLGNGLARAIFFPGLQYSQEEPRRESLIPLHVASTNATVDTDSLLAAINVGTLRQHVGSMHYRTVASAEHQAQVQGTTLRATMMGNTVVVSPERSLFTGTPNAHVEIGGGSSINMVGPLQWESVEEPGQTFSIPSRSRSVRIDRNADVGEALPRMSSTTRGLAGRGSVQVPKDCRKDAFLKTLDMRSMTAGFAGIQYEKWITSGLCMPKFEVVIRYPPNAFTGLTWVMSFDAYNRITTSITTTASPVYTLSVPHWLLFHAKGTTTCELDYGELCGHAMWFESTTFESPKLHFTCITGNNKELAADWEFVVELYAEMEPVSSFLGRPNFVHTANPTLGSFKFFTLQPQYYALNTASAIKNVALDLGSTLRSGTNLVYSYNNALLSYFLGFGGIIKGKIHFCGPITYGAVIRIVSEWAGNTATWNNVFKYPGVNVDSSGEFEIEIRSPYHRTPLRLMDTQVGTNMSTLSLYAISGPIAPSGETADMPIILEIDEIKLPDLSVPTFPNDYFLWVDFSAFTVDEEEYVIGSRFFDISSSTSTVALGNNPFAHMIACHGLHCGTLELKFMWSLGTTTYGGSSGSVIFTKLCGDKATGLDGGSEVIALQELSHTTSMYIGNFAGVNPNTALSLYSRWFAIKLDKARSMKILRVLCRPIGDFNFYGRTSFRV